MVQDYFGAKMRQSSTFNILRPNITKLFLRKVFSILGFFLLLAVLFFILQFTAGLDLFKGIIETFKMDIFATIFSFFTFKLSRLNIFRYIILAISSLIFIIIAGNYLIIRSLRYEFYNDRMIAYKHTMLILVSSREIPFQNIIRISYNKEGFFNSLFSTGTITLDISGMKISKLELISIDHADKAAKFIQDSVREYIYVQQAKFTENYKIDKVFERPN